MAGWLYAERMPDATAVFKLVAHFSVDFATELLSIVGIIRAWRRTTKELC